MCGRYYVEPDIGDDELAAMISEINGRGTAVKTGEVSPGDVAAIAATDRRRRPAVFAMKWGVNGSKGLVINARSESAAERPLFAESLKIRRCVIPATYYYEWERRGEEKIKYAFRADAPLRMAGLYRVDGGQASFVILTREAAPDIAHIHDRMPVLLPPADIAEWLSPDGDAARIMQSAVTSVWLRRADADRGA